MATNGESDESTESSGDQLQPYVPDSFGAELSPQEVEELQAAEEQQANGDQ